MEYSIQDTTLTNIANAIRSKTKGTSPILVSNFASSIENIPSGGTSGFPLKFIDDAKETGLNNVSLTYEVEEDGVYVIISSVAYWGSTLSITLPEERTPIVSYNKLTENGSYLRVVQLYSGDVITASAASRNYRYSKGVVIFKLDSGVSITELLKYSGDGGSKTITFTNAGTSSDAIALYIIGKFGSTKETYVYDDTSGPHCPYSTNYLAILKYGKDSDMKSLTIGSSSSEVWMEQFVLKVE